MGLLRDMLVDIVSEGIPDSVKEASEDVAEGTQHLKSIQHNLDPITIKRNARTIRRSVDIGFVAARCYKEYRKYVEDE